MSGNAFLAVDLSDDERHMLSAALSAAGPGHPIPGKRPPEGNWHITLRFIGECSDSNADRIAHEVARDLSSPPGRVFLSGLGAFPRASKASVMYIAIDDHEKLLGRLSAVCEAAVRHVGLDPEERPFVPHLTISRLRPSVDVRRLIDAFTVFRVPIAVDAITIFRSVVSRSGATYDALHTIDL